jgi:hypothetical protein
MQLNVMLQIGHAPLTGAHDRKLCAIEQCPPDLERRSVKGKRRNLNGGLMWRPRRIGLVLDKANDTSV